MIVKILKIYLIFSSIVGILNVINFISIGKEVERKYKDKTHKTSLFEFLTEILRLFLLSYVPILNISFLYCFFKPEIVTNRIDKAVKEEKLKKEEK